MRLKRAVVGFCAALAGPGLGLLGCGGDKGGTASATDGASESNSSGGTSEPTGTGAPTSSSGSMSASEGDDAGSMSASMSGTTDISGGMSASMSGSEDSGDESGDGSGSTSTSTGMVSGGGETSLGTSTTGEPVNCANFNDEAECVAADCMAIKAQLFFDDGAGWCVNAASFLGCSEPLACDAVILTACKGQTKYQFPNGCLPPGFMACEPPPDAGMDGYPDCN